MSQEYFAPSSFNEIPRSEGHTVSLSARPFPPTKAPRKTTSGDDRQVRTALTLGHNGYLLPVESAMSPSSPPSPSDADEHHGTISEFYGPSASIPSFPQPYLETTTREPANPPTTAVTATMIPRPRPQGYRPNPPHTLTYPYAAPHNSTQPGFISTMPDPTRATPLIDLSGHQTFIDCPHCHHRCLTRLEEESGEATYRRCKRWLACCLLGALMPLIIGLDQDIVYYCGRCNERVAKQKYSAETRGLLRAEREEMSDIMKKPRVNNEKPPKRGPRDDDDDVVATAAPEVTFEQSKKDVYPVGTDPMELPATVTNETRVEVDGSPHIMELAGSAATDPGMSTEKSQATRSGQAIVSEMEHVNRGLGTQKRIRQTLRA